MDAELIGWLAEISAINAQVEGMKAENYWHTVRDMPGPNDDTDFEAKADELYQISTAAKMRAAMGQ